MFSLVGSDWTDEGVKDYVDACERLGQLKLTEVQQREMVRVILHCCGNVRSFPQNTSHTQS